MPGNLSNEGLSPTSRKNTSHYLRAFRDLKCPSCGSNVYWGTHRCRRCGLDFPEELVLEIDQRTMKHYIPINYEGIAQEQKINNLLIYTITSLLILIILSAFTRETVVSDIGVSYLISWMFFVIVLISVMLTIFYLTELRDLILSKTNLMYALLIMAVVGLVIGFSAIVHVAVYSGSEVDLLACAIFIILSALVLAAGRSHWIQISAPQLQLASVGTICITWVALRTFMYEDWLNSFFGIGGGPLITIIILIVGISALYAFTYYIFNGTEFRIRMTGSYPIWFAGISFLAVFTFSKAALFKKDLMFNYVETMLFSSAIVLISISLFILLRKYKVDRYLQNHLARSKAGITVAEDLYSKGRYSEAIKRYEKLLSDNPCLVFGSNNTHPALELLGIHYIYSGGGNKPKGGPGSEGRTVVTPVDSTDISTGAISSTAEIELNTIDESTEEDIDVRTEGVVTENTGVDDSDFGNDDAENEAENDPELIQAEASALIKKSTFYEKAGMRQKALMCIERSIKLDRSRAESWIRLGHLNSQIGGSWDRIKGYYEWVIDIKLHAIQRFVESESVPPRYTLWLIEELAVLKNNLLGMGRALRTIRTAGTSRPDIVKGKKLR